MAMKIRLARGGSKKRPHYSIVAADSRSPRDGRFIEKLGTYDPLLAKDNENRVKIDVERAQYWIGQGAQATDRVARFLEAAGVVEKTVRIQENHVEAFRREDGSTKNIALIAPSSMPPVANATRWLEIRLSSINITRMTLARGGIASVMPSSLSTPRQ